MEGEPREPRKRLCFEPGSNRIKLHIQESYLDMVFDSCRRESKPSSKRSNAMEYQSNGFHYVPDGIRKRLCFEPGSNRIKLNIQESYLDMIFDSCRRESKPSSKRSNAME